MVTAIAVSFLIEAVVDPYLYPMMGTAAAVGLVGTCLLRRFRA